MKKPLIGADGTMFAINWNAIEDENDLLIWQRLTSNFWLPEAIPVSNDLQSWSKLTEEEKLTTQQVFGGLSLLDSMQSAGAQEISQHALTPHEGAVMRQISHLEDIHAKSYSSIFSTLNSTEEINRIFRWVVEDEHLQKKAQIVQSYYDNGDPLKMRVASTMLESFLFYSGFYWPFYLSAHGKLTNTADIIRLIVRDECMTADHDLLTPQGWKPISEITTDDLVAQYDKDSGNITFVHPVRTSNHFADYTWGFESQQGHVNLSVSPKHRMYLERRDYGKGTEYFPEVVEADDLQQSRLNGYARIVHGGHKMGGRSTLTPVERLLIAISADGGFDTTTKNKNGELRRDGSISGFVPVKFSFSKEKKIRRIAVLAEQAGWQLVENKPSKGNGNVKEKRNFTLAVPVEFVDRSRLLSNIAELSDVDYQWCQEFIQELSLWDGYDGGNGKITWGTTVSQNADYVQAVAALAGYRTLRKLVEDNRSENFSDYHKIHIVRGRISTSAQTVQKTKKEGQMVYGVEVPSTFLLTRNGGSVSITGNSVHGYYIGYKYQKTLETKIPEVKKSMETFTRDLATELYENEIIYTRNLYDPVGLTEDALHFIRYNMNKAMMNLGYEAPFSADQTKVSAAILASLSPDGNENHDFFSGAGSSYVMAEVEELDESDWDF